MKNRLTVFFLLTPLLGVLACVTTGPVSPVSIRKNMESIRNEIAANRSALERLKDRRVGKSGFYYVVDYEGRVVFHPQAALIGSSFGGQWIINQLLAEKAGCLTYQLGNRKHFVFYEPLGDSEILCLSIISEDIAQLPADCRQAEIR